MIKPYPNEEPTVTILHDSEEWETQFDAPIKEIRVDGQKLNDVHDLTLKIDGMTGIIKKLAHTATVLAVVAVTVLLAIGAWLLIHQEQLTTSQAQLTTSQATAKLKREATEKLKNSNFVMRDKLKSLGWKWNSGNWQQIGNSTPSPSIQAD